MYIRVYDGTVVEPATFSRLQLVPSLYGWVQAERCGLFFDLRTLDIGCGSNPSRLLAVQ